MRESLRDNHPLKHLFTGLVEHAFLTELGICDMALADYVSDLLIDFVHMDEMHVARDVAGQPIGDIGAMIGEWENTKDLPVSTRDLYLHRRIGDYTLFWTGVYPEGVRRRSGPTWRDRLAEYVECGKRAYALASELTPPDAEPRADLLRRLSREFEVCVHGLGIVRAGLDSPQVGEGGGLIY